jgi:hypothetical protein
MLTAIMLALSLASGPVFGQGRGSGQGRSPGAGAGVRGAGPMLLRDSIPDQGPIELLLVRSDTFQLSASQILSLQNLATRLAEQNAPLIQGLLEVRREIQPLMGTRPRDMTPEQRALFARQATRARPLMQQIHRNNVSAMARVSELLTPPQKRNVRRWLNESGLLEGPGAASGLGSQRRHNRQQEARAGNRVW